MECAYIVEGLNFPFNRCVYRDYEEAIDDIRIDYPNADGGEVSAPSHSVCIVTLGNGNVIAITRVQLL